MHMSFNKFLGRKTSSAETRYIVYAFAHDFLTRSISLPSTPLSQLTFTPRSYDFWFTHYHSRLSLCYQNHSCLSYLRNKFEA
jgi:hypothetical protein